MAIKKDLYSRLQRLFSTNVVVRAVGNKKYKVFDSNALQSSGNPTQSKNAYRYSRFGNPRNLTAINGYGGRNYETAKVTLYVDYDSMDTDSIISAALDIYADEATRKNEYDDILTIHSPNDDIKRVLHNLFYDILNVEFNLWPWIRNLCKYGDMYLYLDIKEEIGVINVTPLSTYDVIREDGVNAENPYETRFSLMGSGRDEYIDSFQVAHFRLLSDSNFLPYGKSILEGARKSWKQLTLLEDSMLISRIMRAPERRIIKVDVGDIDPKEVDNFIEQLSNSMKKQPYIDPQTGDYDLRFNLMNMLEDYIIPVRGGNSGSEISTLEGIQFTGIEDIDYIKNRMLAGLKIPKAFLTFDENLGGKALLAAEDVRFARSIERVQRIVVSELTKIAVIHLFAQGYKNEDLVNFEISLTTPSIVYEQEQLELWKSKMDLAASVLETKLLSRDWIYKRIFKFSNDNIQHERDQVIEDMKYAFRLSQIESEGNDPAITGESFGTPHDIASLHIKNKNGDNLPIIPKEAPDGGWPGAGRPKEFKSNYGKQTSNLSVDPIGKTGAKQIRERQVSGDVKNMLDSYRNKVKTKQIILESMNTEQTPDTDEKFLNESNIDETIDN